MAGKRQNEEMRWKVTEKLSGLYIEEWTFYLEEDTKKAREEGKSEGKKRSEIGGKFKWVYIGKVASEETYRKMALKFKGKRDTFSKKDYIELVAMKLKNKYMRSNKNMSEKDAQEAANYRVIEYLESRPGFLDTIDDKKIDAIEEEIKQEREAELDEMFK